MNILKMNSVQSFEYFPFTLVQPKIGVDVIDSFTRQHHTPNSQTQLNLKSWKIIFGRSSLSDIDTIQNVHPPAP